MRSGKNSEGYTDVTATIALHRVEEYEKQMEFIKAIHKVCNRYNRTLCGRIVTVDNDTGKTWY